MKKLNEYRIVFMGTPQFSVPILEALIERYDVVGVVTQPDKRVGRKQELVFSPVKECAMKHQIPVFQPEKIRKEYEDIIKKAKSLKNVCYPHFFYVFTAKNGVDLRFFWHKVMTLNVTETI